MSCWSNNNENYLEFAKKIYESILKYDEKKLISLKNLSKKILNIGFVSGDLREHSVVHFLLDTLKYLRNKNLKLFAYSNNEIEDDFTKLIKNSDHNIAIYFTLKCTLLSTSHHLLFTFHYLLFTSYYFPIRHLCFLGGSLEISENVMGEYCFLTSRHHLISNEPYGK